MENTISVAPIKKPVTLNEQAYESIKSILTSGQLEENTIDSASKLAKILGVSRTPIRDALIQLTNEGFLVSVHKRGFKIKKYSKKEIMDFFETRKIIEVYIIEHLAERINQADLKKLSSVLKLMKEHAKQGNKQAFLEADRDFHMILIYRYNNHLLTATMDNIRSSMALFGKKALLAKEGRTEEVIKEHEKIVHKLKQKSAKNAAKALCNHLDITQKYLLENY